MATIDELFAKMEADSMYSDVHDIIYIDPVSRQLHVPDTELVLGVAGDKRGERKYFSCPNVVGNGVTLSACSLNVNYVNAAGEVGSFCVTDIVQDEENTLFSWELSEKVTNSDGDVKFSICVCRETGSGDVVNEWSTTTAIGKVLPGIDTSDSKDEDVDNGGAGGIVTGLYTYTFSPEALGSEQPLLWAEFDLLDATLDSIDESVSAPWKLLGLAQQGGPELDHNGLFVEGSMALQLYVAKDGVYRPSIKHLTSEHSGSCNVYLSEMLPEDSAMAYNSTTQGNAANAAAAIAERIEDVTDTETLGVIDANATEQSYNVTTFASVPLKAGMYVLLLDTTGYVNILSVTLSAMSTAPQDVELAIRLQQHLNDTNNPHGVTAAQVGAGAGGTGDGGYYTPNIEQTNDNTAVVSFTPSSDSMPAVADVTLTLPRGADGHTPVIGVDYYTDDDITDVVNRVMSELPIVMEVDY